MTSRSSVDRAISEWLVASAPGRAPVDVLSGALERVVDARQEHHFTQRLLGDRLGRSPAIRWALVAVLAALALAGVVAVLGSWLAPPGPRGIGGFAPGPSLLVGRGDHTVTALPDGRILVMGGRTHVEAWVPASDTVEIWDPAIGGGFVRSGPTSEERSQHTATLLPDGRVLVVGGIGADGDDAIALSTVEIWDPATGDFTDAGRLAQARFDHSATLLADGRVLIAGGTDGQVSDYAPLRSIEIWEPRASAPRPAGELGAPLSEHTALLLADGRVLLVGTADSVILDPATGESVRGPSLAEPRSDHTVTQLVDGRVLVVGGMWGANAGHIVRATVEAWDPGSDGFEVIGRLSVPRAGHTATRLRDGGVLIAGGDEPRTFEIWDPRRDSSSATGPMFERRNRSSTATVLSDGRVIVIGAMSRTGIPTATEIWGPHTEAAPLARPTLGAPSTARPVPAAPG